MACGGHVAGCRAGGSEECEDAKEEDSLQLTWSRLTNAAGVIQGHQGIYHPAALREENLRSLCMSNLYKKEVRR